MVLEAEQLDEVIKRAADGDANCFARLIEAHYMMIYKTAYKWIGNQEDAEDIAQDVCIKLGRAIRSFKGESKFSSWLYRITINAAKDFGRSKSRQPFWQDAEGAIIENTPDAGPNPESAMMEQDIWRAIHDLPEKQRDAMLLVYAEGLSHKQAAEIMDSKESTISWYIHEAKKTLSDLKNDERRQIS